LVVASNSEQLTTRQPLNTPDTQRPTFIRLEFIDTLAVDVVNQDFILERRIPHGKRGAARAPRKPLEVFRVNFKMLEQLPIVTGEYAAEVLAIAPFAKKHVLAVGRELVAVGNTLGILHVGDALVHQ